MRVSDRISSSSQFAPSCEQPPIVPEHFTAVTHEMRTPLTAIKAGIALAMEEGDVSHGTRELLDLCARNTDRLLELVNGLLDLSRIKNGTSDSMGHVSLTSVIDEAVQEFAPLASTQHVTMTVHAPGTLMVAAAPIDIRRIIDNLLGNALKFSPGGHIDITAECKGGEIVVRVRDTGIGIPRDRLGTVFDRFVQIQRSSIHGGSGLGLAITHALVERYNGRISVTSRPGHGSCFTVVLPCDETERTYSSPVSSSHAVLAV